MAWNAPDRQGVPKILHIDDDEALGILLRRSLSRQGFDVICALDGRSGLEMLAAGGIDAVILDHYLLGETGLDILPDIVKSAGHPPVVYVTGTGEAGVAVEALKCGAADYVAKTISMDFFDCLVAALRRVLEPARQAFDRG